MKGENMVKCKVVEKNIPHNKIPKKYADIIIKNLATEAKLLFEYEEAWSDATEKDYLKQGKFWFEDSGRSFRRVEASNGEIWYEDEISEFDPAYPYTK